MTAGFSKSTASWRLWLSVPIILICLNVVPSAIIAAVGMLKPDSLDTVCDHLCLSDSVTALLHKPWTALSYAFVNGGLLQLTFNMLWLYCFSRLLLMRTSQQALTVIYLSAALAGAAAYVTLYPLVSQSLSPSLLMGSSASVIAVAVTVAFLMPDAELNIPLFGMVKIKWITGAVVILFCIGLTSDNVGGNLAHLGGAVAGAVAGTAIRLRQSNGTHTTDAALEYRRLTDKVRTAGYESLSAIEKRRFFELSANRHRI